MKKILFLISFLVANVYPMATEIDRFEGTASAIILQIQSRYYRTYMPSTGTIEIYVKKAPIRSRIATLVKGSPNIQLLELICNDPKLAPRVTKISFEPGVHVVILPCIGKLVNLKSLILRNVRLEPYGEKQLRIPAEIGNLKKLQTLDLGQDSFFPDERKQIEEFLKGINVNIQFF